MPPRPKVSKEEIIDQAYMMIKTEGIEQLNARSLANRLGCSTQPIFKNFKNMEELKQYTKVKIDEQYDAFIKKYHDTNDELFSIASAYIHFASEERHLFGALFVHPLIESRNMSEVLTSSWNLETIANCQKQYVLSRKQAEDLYRDVRFYSHGIATQIYAGTIILSKGEIEELVRNAIDRFK
ncbi:TetR/AcrR family transcriptional regulator [Beduini massiliensis]|uniref:TetR/AcrR family transcriptional regulator n=1 Tax=Beduini massiliensis TaxID=1585974 RepID=UPI00059A9665|nr:TetR/AcrR family transcriptional regulator [Beduini massiliensis]